MANPNKTVGNWRRKNGFPARERSRPFDDFITWLFAQAKAGRTFKDEKEARDEFNKEIR